MKRTILFIISCVTTLLSFSQDGSSGAPYTALGQAWHVPSSGTYFFNIGGTSFSTYVEAGSGWILVASGNGSTTETSYSTTSALTLQSDQLLSSTIYTSALVISVRMNATSGSDTPFDVTSTNSGVLTNLRNNRTLSVSTNQSAWTGTNVTKLNPSCGSGNQSLNLRIYHSGCDGTSMHWQPVLSQEKVNLGGTVNDLNLWVRAAAIDVFPIELNYFEANVIDGLAVKLSWETLQEVNNDYFSIERSADETSWEVIKTIESVGTSSEPISYSFIDRNTNSKTLFYRLRQTDFDGQSTFSPTRMVQLELEKLLSINIFPNPAEDVLTVRGDSHALIGIRIFDLMGQPVSHQVPIRNRSEFIVEFEVSQLPTGIYTIVTESSSGIFYKQ